MKMRSILVIAVLGFIFMLGLTLQLANAMPLMNDRPQNHRLFITDPLPNSAASWLPGYTPTVNVTITGTGPSNLSHQESDSLIRDGLLIWEEPIYRYQQQTRVWNLLTNQIEWQWTIDHTNKYIQFAFSNHDPNSVQLTVSWVPNNQKFMSEEDGLTSFNDLSKEEEGMIALGYADRTTNTIYLNSSWHWDRYQLYRFKKIITHEFGHILNFAHNDYFEYVNDNLVVSIMHRGSEALWWNGWIMNELFGIEYQLGPIKDQIELGVALLRRP